MLDEAWAVVNVQQGKSLINKLVRAGRSMNAGVFLNTQNAVDVNDETIKNNLGQKFVFHSSDSGEIRQALDFLGLEDKK